VISVSLSPPDRRVSVVTGASAGIGAATARALAAAGHPVALGARRLDRCEQIAAEIRAAGGEAVALSLDVGDDDSVKAFAGAIEAALGSPEIVISNAGTVRIGSAAETSTAQIENDLNVSVLGAHRLITTFVPAMIERQRGDIVFVSSDSVVAHRPGVAGYIAAKCGLEGLVNSLRADLEGTGVRASMVRPGPTISEIAADWDAEALSTLYSDWQRWGVVRHDGLLQAEQVAQAITTVATLPRGMHVTMIEVQPEAPICG
jgi:NADP-dependent 3-hydroxy acid dehydrogenase YdfG